MTKYRKKAVIIEAKQWFKNGDHSEVQRCNPGDFHKLSDGKTNIDGWGWDACGVVGTMEGRHLVIPGDWIIRGVKGEYYPCKPDIFEMTYEKVET